MGPEMKKKSFPNPIPIVSIWKDLPILSFIGKDWMDRD